MSTLLNALVPRRGIGALSVNDWAEMFAFGNFPLALNQTLNGNREELEGTFGGLVQGAYRANGIVFACMLTRMMLLSEARFVFQQLRGGRTGDLFGTSELTVLETPEPGKVTGDLLMRTSVDYDLAGNYFAVRRPGPRIKRLRPDWTAILLGSRTVDRDPDPTDPDAEFVGLIHVPGGLGSGNDPITYRAEEVVHLAGPPDPLAQYRGMSWLTPIVRDIQADSATIYHKLQFFNNAATPNAVVTLDPRVTLAKAREWIEVFEEEHAGALNAFKTAYLGGGASMEVVGRDMQQMDFRNIKGAGEVAIAAAAGVHPVIAGFSEGLQGASLNQGNFTAARRLLSDRTLRPWWRNFAGSMQSIVPPPPSSRLWYDVKDIPFLAEDHKDAAEVQSKQATAIRTLVDGGFKPEAVIDAITSGDLSRLRGDHTGLLPVQLQPPGAGDVNGDGTGATGAITLYQRAWPAPPERSRPTGDVRALVTFWPVSGIAQGLHVERGDTFDAADDVVLAFPQFFASEQTGAGPALLVTKPQVIAAKRELAVAGQPSGYDAIARHLNVSPATVRRRLNGS